jgi:hypothetical protein
MSEGKNSYFESSIPSLKEVSNHLRREEMGWIYSIYVTKFKIEVVISLAIPTYNCK